MAAKRERRRRRKTGWSTAAQEVVDRVFVYGTLRSGQTARSMIGDHVVDSQPATLPGKIYAFSEGYPGYVADGDAPVVGEIVTLQDLTAAFLLLDAYEGSDYQRILVKARDADGNDTWCWVYALVDAALADNGELIESGDWAKHSSSSRWRA